MQQAVDRWRPGEGRVLVKVELTNAFNSIDRRRVLEAVKARAPHLLPFGEVPPKAGGAAANRGADDEEEDKAAGARDGATATSPAALRAMASLPK